MSGAGEAGRVALKPCFACWTDSENDDLSTTGSLVDVCKHENGMECLYAIECDRCGARGQAAFKHQGPERLWNRLFERMHRIATAPSAADLVRGEQP